MELSAVQDNSSQHLLLLSEEIIELDVEVLVFVYVGEEEAVALPEESAGVAVERGFVVVFVGDIDLEVLVAERTLVVVYADGGDLVVEFAGWELGGRLDCLGGILGVVRVVDDAVPD